jgi:hypothetical protein
MTKEGNMSRRIRRWVDIPSELRSHRQVRIGAMIGFLMVSTPTAWLFFMFAR